VEYMDASGAVAVSAPAARSVTLLADSFTEVVERYQTPLVQFLYGMVGNVEQAEDLAQDTLLKAYEAMEHRRPGQQFSAGWLYRIARNTALDALRRKRLIAWLPIDLVEAILPTRGDFAGRVAERELVQEVLACLPARYRACLLLRTVAGLSNGEIAESMGISTRNVNTLLFRARERFRMVYAQAAGADAEPGTGTEEQNA
jgi:RNA polymerase sigma-70 factor, ECF subfamily